MWKRLAGVMTGLVGRGRSMMGSVFGGRRGEAPIRGTREFLQVYETSPWVRAVAGKTASHVGATEWTLEARGRAVEKHILLSSLRRPNPLMSGHQLMKITQLCLDLVGDAFWLKARNPLGAPVEFYPIPPHWVIELPTPGNSRFRVSQYGWQEEIPDTEIFWLHDAAPADPYGRGSGLVRAQADELETHEYASKHAKQIFWNRAIPEFVVMDHGASKEDVAHHEQAFSQRLQGFWRWYKPYFVNRKLEFWQPQQMNLENLTMVPLMKHERDTIIQAWGFPPEQLGIVENSNRATIDGSDYVFERRIVRPRREFIRDSVQAGLVPEYDDRLVFGFVDTVPEDKEHKLNVAKAAPHALTLDEWRGLTGLKPEGGDLGKARLVPMNSYLTADPLDPETRPQGAGAAMRATDEPGAPPSKDISRREGRLVVRALDAVKAMVERPPQPITLAIQQGDVTVEGKGQTLLSFSPEMKLQLQEGAVKADIHLTPTLKAELPDTIGIRVTEVPTTSTRVTERGDQGIVRTETRQE